MAFESEAMQYSRLLRPYSLKRMAGALWYVEARAGGISNRKNELLIEPPVDAAEWQGQLEAMQNDLEILAEQCEEAHKKLGLLIRSAPADYERAVDAMHKVLLGINAAERVAA